MVAGTGYRRGFHGHIGEIAELVHALLGELDLFGIVPAALHLTHFLADDLIPGPRVATDVDTAYIDPLARIHEDGEGDLALFLVHFGCGVHVGKGVAFAPQTVGNGLLGFIQFFPGENLARLDGHQLAQFGFRRNQVTRQLHRGNDEPLPLIDADGDVDVLLVRTDGNLGGLHIEFQIAPVLVIGLEAFQVGGKLLFGILIVLGIPGQPARRLQLEEFQQFLFLEGLVADDVDLLDLGRIAFVNGEVDGNPVPLQRRYRGLDLHRVFAAGEILALQLLLRLVQQGPVEDAGLGQTDVLQALLQLVLVELLEADKIDLGDGRALFQHQDHDIAINLDAHILEKAGGEQGLDGLGGTLVIQGVADADRQVAEYGTGFGTLNTFNTDIFDHKRVEGLGRRSEKRRNNPCQQVFVHIQPEINRLMSL